MLGINAVDPDAAVFLDINFIAVPVGEGSVPLVLGGIQKVYPDIVVVSFIVGIDSGGNAVVEFEGEVEPLIDLASELEVEMLFLVSCGHHIIDFGVGKERQVGFEVFFSFDVIAIGGQFHVESNIAFGVESHGVVCQSDVGEG